MILKTMDQYIREVELQTDYRLTESYPVQAALLRLPVESGTVTGYVESRRMLQQYRPPRMAMFGYIHSHYSDEWNHLLFYVTILSLPLYSELGSLVSYPNQTNQVVSYSNLLSANLCGVYPEWSREIGPHSVQLPRMRCQIIFSSGVIGEQWEHKFAQRSIETQIRDVELLTDDKKYHQLVVHRQDLPVVCQVMHEQRNLFVLYKSLMGQLRVYVLKKES